ncbi:MAG: hypothetical protein IT373_34515 [Polyangiaceae bacterium]|nr:hypothetical protein [Polyangiaceae bacterium]
MLLRPAARTPVAEETLTRARAELELAGFEVVVVDQAGGAATVRVELERAATEAGAIAAIAVEGDSAAADVWVTDRLTGKTLVRRLDGSGGRGARGPATLAIRAVELLRASLGEAGGPDAGDELPGDVASWMRSDALAAHAVLSGFGASLGVGLVQSFDGLGPAFGPVVRLSCAAPMGLGGRLALVGPGGGPSFDGPLGRASALQTLIVAEAVYAPVLGGSRFVPLASAGVGAYYLHASGELDDPSLATSGGSWAAAFVLGGGLAARPTPNVAVTLDLDLLFTAPRVVVAMAGEPVGSAGRPSLVAALGVVATSD